MSDVTKEKTENQILKAYCSEKQENLIKKIAERLALPLPDKTEKAVNEYITKNLEDYIDAKNQASEKQINFAEQLSLLFDLPLPEIESGENYSIFIDEHAEKLSIFKKSDSGPATINQLKLAKKLAEDQNIPLPELRSYDNISKFNSENLKPTKKQIKFANSISKKTGVPLPDNLNIDTIKQFIEKNKDKLNYEEGSPTKKQLILLKTLKIQYDPEKITFEEATNLINLKLQEKKNLKTLKIQEQEV